MIVQLNVKLTISTQITERCQFISSVLSAPLFSVLFTSLMNIPKPMTQNIIDKIVDATVSSKSTMNVAANDSREMHTY